MKAAAEFLSGNYPSANKAANVYGLAGPNVSYYVRQWRDASMVEEMVHQLLDLSRSLG